MRVMLRIGTHESAPCYDLRSVMMAITELACFEFLLFASRHFEVVLCSLPISYCEVMFLCMYGFCLYIGYCEVSMHGAVLSTAELRL